MNPIVELAARLAQLEQTVGRLARHGTVTDVDPAKGLVRVKLGDGDDGDVLSPWIPYSQIGGALKVHSPPTVGQQMAITAPGGDLRQGMATPLGFSSANPSPSGAGDEHVLTFGNVTVTMKGDSLVIAVGSSTITVGTASVSINSPRIDLN